MKRELKFRCFDTLSPKMYVGHSLAISANGTISFLDDTGNWIEPEEGRVIVMQYTGLSDRNKKEVYQGDLILMYRHDDITNKHEPAKDWVNGKYEWVPKEVKFLYGSFVIWSEIIKDYRCFANLARPGESFEVIGNVYENPEMLERKQ